MAFVITRVPRMKGAVAEVPLRKDGSRYEWCMSFASNTRHAWADDVRELVGVLAGLYAYPELDPQQALVERIKVAVRAQVIVTAQWCSEAMLNGDWDRLTEVEKRVLLSRRDRQPRGWSTDLLGHDYWSTTKPPLVLVTTGWWGEEHLMPRGSDRAIVWLDPLTDDSLLDSLEDCGEFVTTWFRAES